MLKHLTNLVKLQKVDNKLLEINAQKGDLPQIVNALKDEIGRLVKAVNEGNERQKRIKIETNEDSVNINTYKEQLDKYQDQLYLVTSNKEYDALTAEIDNLKQKIDQAEYDILKRSEELDELAEKIKSNDLTLNEKQTELEKRQTELEKATNDTETEQQKLQTEKDGLVETIPLRFVREYQRIAKAKEGTALVPIMQIFDEQEDKEGNIEYIPSHVSCGGCHKIVPPQKVMEIRSGKRLLRCEFCGRLLYWDDTLSNSTENLLDEIF